MRNRHFTTTVAAAPRGHLLIPVPFDPDTTWGAKPRHQIGGTVNGMRVRGTVEPAGDGHGFTLGPAWQRDCGLAVGDTVTVDIEPEGPQRSDLAAALDAHPKRRRSSTPSPSSTAAPTSAGSTPPNATPTNADSASPK